MLLTLSGRSLPRRLKLTPLISLAGAVLLFAAGVAMAVYEDGAYRAQKTNEVRVQARILAASVSAALAFDDPRTAQEFVNALKVNIDIESVEVDDLAGRTVAGFIRQGATAARNPSSSPGSQINIVVPVEQNNVTLGRVYLKATTESLERRIFRYIGVLLLGIMGALVLAVAFASQIALSRANRELEAQARNLAKTNEQLQIEMSERASAEEALRQSQKMEAIGQLSGGIAHDFNNLLMIAMSSLQVLERRLAQGQTNVQQYIAFAVDGLKRAAELTQRILAFSRRQPLSPKAVSLSRLVDSMMTLLRHSVGENIRILIELKSDWLTLCDANQMENVVLNLGINSRDAMPEGGTLTIRTENMHVVRPLPGFDGLVPGDYVQLSVADTGVGMSEDVRQRAIDPFFTTKPQGQGTGLGLSMTFGFVSQSNGYMKIDSEPGKGTTITILMPRYNGITAERA